MGRMALSASAPRLALWALLLLRGTLCVTAEAGVAKTQEAVQAPAAGGDQHSASQRLLFELLAIFASMSLGFVCVRLGVLQPEQGHMAAMSFYTGNIGLPLLVFRAVATADLGGVIFGVLIACTVAKAIVMFAVWLVTFLAYRPRTTSTQQRFQAATVFSMCACSTNDFALGIPVIEALYGRSMTAYIAANAVIGSALFVPFTSILLTIGASLGNKDGEEVDEPAPSERSLGLRMRLTCCWVLCALRDAFKSYVILSAIVGVLFKLAFGWLLTNADGHQHLPGMLARVIELFVQPFAMLSLFMTGTSLRNASLSIWSVGLVLMKVLVCAFLSYQLGTMLTAGVDDTERRQTLNNFCFFYGTIPASATPLILASKFAPEAAGLIAMTILLMLFASGAIMYMFAAFQTVMNEASHIFEVVASVQIAISAVSVASMTVLLVVFAVFHRHWGWSRPGKMLLGTYGLAILTFQTLMLVFDGASVRGRVCYSDAPYLLKAVGFCQNLARLLLLWGEARLMFFWGTKVQRPKDTGRSGYVMIPVTVLASALLAWFIRPNAVNEVCRAYANRWVVTVQEVTVVHYLDTVLLLLMAAIGAAGLALRGRLAAKFNAASTEQRGVRQQASSELEAGDAAYTNANAESDDECNSSSDDTDVEGENKSAEGAQDPATSSSGSDSESDEEEAFKDDKFLCKSLRWQETPPRSVVLPLVLAQVVQLIMQTINSRQVLRKEGDSPTGFVVMLILEYSLVHGQGLMLLLGLFMNKEFTKLLSAMVRRLFPWGFRKEQSAITDPTFHHSMSAGIEQSVACARAGSLSSHAAAHGGSLSSLPPTSSRRRAASQSSLPPTSMTRRGGSQSTLPPTSSTSHGFSQSLPPTSSA